MLTSILSKLRFSWLFSAKANRNGDDPTTPGSKASPSVPEEPLEIAIVGCGIIGTILALGLVRRNIKVTVYEQARSLREIGAGIAFTANARKCMSLIDERIVDCVTAVATINGDPENPNNNMQFIDGYTQDPERPDDMSWKKLYKLSPGPRGFEGCHRAHFLEEVMQLMPTGVVKLSKKLDVLEDKGGEKVELRFSDGTVAWADGVIGCDGIKSRVRELMLGEGNPASYPHYTHKIAYRGLVPMDEATDRLGHYRAHNQHMYGGPNAHVLHFPVAKQKLMNVVAFVTDPNDWPLDRNMSQPATKEEVAEAFANWGPTVRAIIDLLPVGMDKWGVFDSLDHPAPTFSLGRVCIAGDAAHASSPHHGAGAGIGVEDALALTSLLEMAQSHIRRDGTRKKSALQAAFSAFSVVRRERSQWLVRSSREACEIYEWNDPHCGLDMEKAFHEIKRRSHKIWYFDIQGMLTALCQKYHTQLLKY
ncbi:hypothetical protein BDV25DRAFT_136943 [Aspergillus avenaceus]|uniref:FAD-binding domain-containing protein n=1 Tax=Aspergillus avenaceus TaxID=36643 RepID=A0A5N6U3X4_ASPAV|nr:hypothetical protein BDV25DRAFT_136943 [Aspergillus avenaceus]